MQTSSAKILHSAYRLPVEDRDRMEFGGWHSALMFLGALEAAEMVRSAAATGWSLVDGGSSWVKAPAASAQHRVEMNTNFFRAFIPSFGNKYLAIRVFGASSQSPIFNFYLAITKRIVGGGETRNDKRHVWNLEDGRQGHCLLYWGPDSRRCLHCSSQFWGRTCLVPRPHYYARPMRFGSRDPFVSDTSPKCIDREGLKRRRTGTRQGADKWNVWNWQERHPSKGRHVCRRSLLQVQTIQM